MLVEKPMRTTLAEAEDLIGWPRERRRVLQVGHIERFNPAVRRPAGDAVAARASSRSTGWAPSPRAASTSTWSWT